MKDKEAELIGMHTGDGTLYKTNKNYLVWEMRGSVNEQEYYRYVSSMIIELFGIDIKPKYRGPASYGIQTCNKILTSFFVKHGFMPGSKVYTVSIPKYIINGNLRIKKAFVRGLFDTDGCVRFDKNRTKFHYYPKIEFGLASKNLRDDLLQLLIKLGFRPYIWQSVRKDGIEYKICLAGFANLEKWIQNIRPANKKHLDRIEAGLLNKEMVKKNIPNL